MSSHPLLLSWYLYNAILTPRHPISLCPDNPSGQRHDQSIGLAHWWVLLSLALDFRLAFAALFGRDVVHYRWNMLAAAEPGGLIAGLAGSFLAHFDELAGGSVDR